MKIYIYMYVCIYMYMWSLSRFHSVCKYTDMSLKYIPRFRYLPLGMNISLYVSLSLSLLCTSGYVWISRSTRTHKHTDTHRHTLPFSQHMYETYIVANDVNISPSLQQLSHDGEMTVVWCTMESYPSFLFDWGGDKDCERVRARAREGGEGINVYI